MTNFDYIKAWIEEVASSFSSFPSFPSSLPPSMPSSPSLTPTPSSSSCSSSPLTSSSFSKLLLQVKARPSLMRDFRALKKKKRKDEGLASSNTGCASIHYSEQSNSLYPYGDKNVEEVKNNLFAPKSMTCDPWKKPLFHGLPIGKAPMVLPPRKSYKLQVLNQRNTSLHLPTQDSGIQLVETHSSIVKKEAIPLEPEPQPTTSVTNTVNKSTLTQAQTQSHEVHCTRKRKQFDEPSMTIIPSTEPVETIICSKRQKLSEASNSSHENKLVTNQPILPNANKQVQENLISKTKKRSRESEPPASTTKRRRG